MEKATKWVGLFLLLIVPTIVYLYITEAENNFINLTVVGPEGHHIPDFSFVNQNGETVTNDKVKGKIYVANFIFTTCPTICPTMTYNMKYVQDKLSVYPDVHFLSHTVDPEKDTPEQLLHYAREMRADLSNWDFLTGEKDELYKIAESYFVNASVDSLAPGGFLHSEHFILVDKEGRVRSGTDKQGNVLGVYDGTKEFQMKDLINDVKVLMAEYKVPKKD